MRHTTQQCSDCGKAYEIDEHKNINQGIKTNKCTTCFWKSVMCSVCKKTKYSDKCYSRNCQKCCTSEHCTVHINENNRCNKCLKTQKICKNNGCARCYCNDNECTVHYTKCDSCSNMIETKKCSHCKDCCRSSQCIHHYIQDRDVTTGLLNSYKVALILKGLPVEIINKTVNEFLDVREKCKHCHRIFSSLSHCEQTAVALQCNSCRKYLCSTCGGVDGYILTYDMCANCCRACDQDLYGDEDSSDDSYYDDDDFDYSDYYDGGISNDAEEAEHYVDYDDYCDRYYEEQGRY